MRDRGSLGARRLAALPAVLVLAAALWMQAPAHAAVCQTSGPTSGAYSVTVCIDGPIPGATLVGPTTVSSTVTLAGSAPAVKKVAFSLGAAYVLSDFEAPYTFTLPTTKWGDGLYALKASATMTDGFTTSSTGENVTLANGLAQPALNAGTFTPTRGTTPPTGQPFVLAAAGDGAAGDAVSGAVASMVSSWAPNMFLYLGDVYERGTPAEFSNWYGTDGRLFGALKPVTNPTIGNHEYLDGSPAGYFDYWGSGPHYYSVDAGGWHIVSLDSTTDFNQVSPGSAQYEWLKQDLGANAGVCTLVYFHHPYLDVTNAADDARLSDLWTLLAQKGVDVVLNGHAHNYQHWRPSGAGGALDATGPTELVVGTAGHGIEPFVRSDPRLAYGSSSKTSFGALRMKLSTSGATYDFVTTGGAVLDSGSLSCGPPAPSAKPFFTDGFESGSMAAWTTSSGISVQSQERYAGSYGARATSAGGATTGRKQLATTYPNVYYRIRFKVLGKGATNVYLAKLRDATDSSVLGVSVNESGQLALTNYVTGSKYAGPAVGPGWHELEVHASVAGASSLSETWLDGTKIPSLTKTESLGTAPIAALQLGDQSTGKTYDIVFDDVAASTGFIAPPAPAPSPSPSPVTSPSPVASADPSPAAPLFSDGFETGSLAGWTNVTGLAVQSQQSYSGTYAARETSTGAATFAQHQLPTSLTDVYARVRFDVLSKANYVYLLKLRDAAGTSVLGVYVADGGQLAYTNYVTGSKWVSGTVIPSGWHTVEVHAVVGGAGQTELWLDGTKVADLTRTESLGTALIGTLQLGDNSTGKTYDVVLDDVAAGTTFIP